MASQANALAAVTHVTARNINSKSLSLGANGLAHSSPNRFGNRVSCIVYDSITIQ
jgi:hypothetical protein